MWQCLLDTVIKFVSDLQHSVGMWFSPGILDLVSSISKTDRKDITEILLA